MRNAGRGHIKTRKEEWKDTPELCAENFARKVWGQISVRKEYFQRVKAQQAYSTMFILFICLILGISIEGIYSVFGQGGSGLFSYPTATFEPIERCETPEGDQRMTRAPPPLQAAVAEHMSGEPQANKTLVFAGSVADADSAADALRQSGLEPLVYHRAVAAADRERILREAATRCASNWCAAIFYESVYYPREKYRHT